MDIFEEGHVRHFMRFETALLVCLVLAGAGLADVVARDSQTGRIFCQSRRFLIPYEAADAGPSGIKAVRLYYTTDGGRGWTLYAAKPEAKGSFEFQAATDGTFGFRVEAEDAAGNIERKDGPLSGTRPEVSVVVDTKAPLVEPVFPREGLELAPGAHLRIRFRASDENLSPSTARIAVKTSEILGWQELENVTVKDGEFFAQGDVLFEGAYNARVSVGDRAGNVTSQEFAFTSAKGAKAPVAEPGPLVDGWQVSLGAPPRAKCLVFDIDYIVDDIGGQPPAAVFLWYTTDDGASWERYGLDPDVTPPFRFQAPVEARYGFKITSQTRSGVTEPRPLPGTRPDINTLVDITFPTLMLDDPRGGESYAGGQVHYVRWTARDANFGSLPMSIHISRDGGEWELLAADLPNTGAYGWNVPFIDYATYRMKLEARDLVGNVTSVFSDTFYVVSAPPETRITAVIPAVPALGTSTTRPEKEPEAAEEVVEEAPPSPPPPSISAEEARRLIDKAAGERLRGEYETAEATLQELLSLDRRNIEGMSELGALLMQAGRHEEAAGVLEDARSLAPGDGDVLYNLASAYYALGKYQESAAVFGALARQSAHNNRALWNQAKAYHAAGEVLKAREVWMILADGGVPNDPYARKAALALEAIPAPPAEKPVMESVSAEE